MVEADLSLNGRLDVELNKQMMSSSPELIMLLPDALQIQQSQQQRVDHRESILFQLSCTNY